MEHFRTESKMTMVKVYPLNPLFHVNVGFSLLNSLSTVEWLKDVFNNLLVALHGVNFEESAVSQQTMECLPR